MFTSVIDISMLADRLDPAFYSPQAVMAEKWLTEHQDVGFIPLGELADIYASAFYEGLVERYTTEGIPFLRVADVQNGTIEKRNLIYLPSSLASGTDGLTSTAGPLIIVTKGGTVGNVGVHSTTDTVALSRDVIGVRVPSRYIPVALFFMASSVGHALLLRGASRQVQAHLTVERLKEFPIPRLTDAQIDVLRVKYDEVLAAREEYELSKEALASSTEEGDPFVELSERHLSYVLQNAQSLRKRMDPEHNRPSQAQARIEAEKNGWREVSSLAPINSRDSIWPRQDESPSRTVNYVALASVQVGSGRITKAQELRVWEVPSRGKWVCQKNMVLAPSLVESLNRVAVIAEDSPEYIASSGFHTLHVEDPEVAAFLAGYLLSRGAHEQILRSGTGVRYRAYSQDELSRLLVPPASRVSEIAQSFERATAAARELDNAWIAGIQEMEKILHLERTSE